MLWLTAAGLLVGWVGLNPRPTVQRADAFRTSSTARTTEVPSRTVRRPCSQPRLARPKCLCEAPPGTRRSDRGSVDPRTRHHNLVWVGRCEDAHMRGPGRVAHQDIGGDNPGRSRALRRSSTKSVLVRDASPVDVFPEMCRTTGRRKAHRRRKRRSEGRPEQGGGRNRCAIGAGGDIAKAAGHRHHVIDVIREPRLSLGLHRGPVELGDGTADCESEWHLAVVKRCH